MAASSHDQDESSDDLVRRCLAGDESSQRQLCDRYRGLCFSVSRRILGQPGQSYIEDAVQDGLCAVFAKLHQWRGGNLAAWIATVAASQALDFRRRLRRSDCEHGGHDLDAIATGRRDGNDQADELIESLEQARRRLTPRQQQVLRGLLEGKTRIEIAQELQVAERTVYGEIGSIRSWIKEFLEKGCRSPEF